MLLPILIPNCQLSQEEYVGYNLTLYKQAYQSKRTKLFVFIGLLTLGLLINLVGYSQGNSDFPLVQSLVFAGLVVLYIVVPMKLRNVLQKRYHALPILQVPSTYKLSDKQIVAENELSHSEMAWSLFTRIDTYDKWVMLHLQNHTFLAFDTTRISLPNTLSDLLELLSQHKLPMNSGTVA